MYQPQLYIKSGVQAQRDTLHVLETYFQRSCLKNKSKILDIGCGPGNVTHDIIYPLLPESTQNLVGIDISVEMVNFARERCQANKKISFYQMDILTDQIPNKFQNEFDFVFSLYCLHMVDNHRKALTNIFHMLRPGGSMLLTFQGKGFIYDIYNSISKKDNWRNYMKDYEKLIPFTHFLDNPVSSYNHLLKEIGFELIDCLIEDRVFEYSEKQFKNIALAIDVFNIPRDKEDQFAVDHIQYFKKTNNFKIDNFDNTTVLYPYTLMIVQATKPL